MLVRSMNRLSIVSLSLVALSCSSGARADAGGSYDAGPEMSCDDYCATPAVCGRPQAECVSECESSRTKLVAPCRHYYSSYVRCRSEVGVCDGGSLNGSCHLNSCAIDVCQRCPGCRFDCVESKCTIEDGTQVFCD